MNVHNRLMVHLARSVIVALSFSIVACATNMKEKIVRNTLIAGAVGAAIGSAYPDYPAAHELMLGSTAAAIAAIASVYYYDPDKEIDEGRKRSRDLAKSMDDFGSGSSVGAVRPLSAGPAINNVQSLPEKYRRLITQGEWALKQIDEWEQIDENRKVHKTEMLELIPATFNQ